MAKEQAHSPAHATPEVVAELMGSGYIETNPLFNVAINNYDLIPRYDVINPRTEERFLWTPKSDIETMELIEGRLGSLAHPIFPALHSSYEDGDLFVLNSSARLLANTLQTAPYVEAYMERLERRAAEFIGQLSLLDQARFGIDKDDLIINHNGDESDDIYLSIAPPVTQEQDR